MTIRILLTSDIHLGMTEKNFIDNREQRLSTFRKIADLAGKHDVFLIAGHLIDQEISEDPLIDAVDREFRQITSKGTEIFYTAAGEELAHRNLSEKFSGIDGVRLFHNSSVHEPVKSEKGNLFIYGSNHNTGAIAGQKKKGFHLGLFHCDFSPGSPAGTEKNDCIDREDIRRMNLNFYALGKSHSFRMFRSMNKIIGAYAGSPEPCSFEETGDRYVVSMEIKDEELSQIKRISVNTDRIVRNEIDCTSVYDTRELLLRINAIEPADCIHDINLTGIRGFSTDCSFNSDLAAHFRGLRIVDSTVPSLEMQIEKHEKEKSIRAELLRSVAKMIEGREIPPDIDLNIVAGLLGKNSSTGHTSGEVLFCTS